MLYLSVSFPDTHTRSGRVLFSQNLIVQERFLNTRLSFRGIQQPIAELTASFGGSEFVLFQLGANRQQIPRASHRKAEPEADRKGGDAHASDARAETMGLSDEGGRLVVVLPSDVTRTVSDVTLTWTFERTAGFLYSMYAL